MSRFRITRRAGVLTATAAAVMLGTAGPALADATVSPQSAVQGSGQNLSFHITNTLTSAITRVKVSLPKDTPIAEVYPLSVDNWAPQITNQKLLTPLATIHGGTPATEATASITWIAMPGKSLAPGQATDLGVAVGPLPTLSLMNFDIQATYANGSVQAMPPVALKLRAATAEDQAALAAEHAGHDAGATAGDGTDSADDSAFAAVVAQADDGPGFWSVTGWIFAALAAAAAIVMMVRSRRRVAPAAPEDGEAQPASADEESKPGEESKKEPVGAGAGKIRASSWRYQDGDK